MRTARHSATCDMGSFPPPRNANHGFAYLALLITIAIIGIAAVATFQVGSILQRRLAEEELLDIGTEFRRALLSYANATPVGQSNYPSNLEALLKDPRYPEVRRHLRKLYFDPLTGTQKWGMIMSPDGKGIIGVYSLAPGTPIKVGNFELQYQSFEGKTTYAGWIFTSIPPQLAAPAGNVTLPNGVPAGGNPAANPESNGGPNPLTPGATSTSPSTQGNQASP